MAVSDVTPSVTPLTFNSIGAARQLGGDVTVLIAGKDFSKVWDCILMTNFRRVKIGKIFIHKNQ